MKKESFTMYPVLSSPPVEGSIMTVKHRCLLSTGVFFILPMADVMEGITFFSILKF